MTAAAQLAAIAKRVKLPMTDEKAAQVEFAAALDAAGVAHKREVQLSKRDIVDFMVGGLAIELKIKGSRTEIARQLERYAEHDRVTEIMLVTCRSIALPPSIGGKPVTVVHASAAWL
jgi:hypothetical protein